MTAWVVSLALLLAADQPAPAAKAPEFPHAGLKFRALGPAVTSGRVVGVAVHPRDTATYYVAAASGGVWKTVNAGTTFAPVFDKEASYSIGVVAIDPKNPETVWVGTGENNSQRSVGYGDGVYKSTNGGKTWTNVGLKNSEHVGKIVIDPVNTDSVFVAAQGPLWNSGGERGLYHTTDGGKTWECVLSVDADTGVTDVVMHAENPKLLLAATYQRRRHVYTLVNGGPGSAIHRSTDGGKTWTKIKAGMPTAELGRVGLASAPSQPNVVYAVVEAADSQGGIHRSENFGQTWEKRNPFDSQAQYYAHAVVDPHDSNRLFVMNVRIQVSNDGGKTLAPLPESNKHVDNHCIWVNPKNQDHMIVGCDGGVYTSHDRARTWRFHENLPITQFYDCGVDQNSKSGKFYHVYGGTQDNFTLGGPVRSRSVNGVPNSDWYVVQGGDGFHCAVDPENPNIVYAEAQYGVLTRFDRKTGVNVSIQPLPAPGEPPLRWNWDSPLLLSAHKPKRVYFAANRLFQSDDRGDSWTAISPDLTRQLNRDELPVFGKKVGPEAVARHLSTSFYGNVTALAESFQDEGTLYAGTDDGLIQVTNDGGKTWTKVDEFPGVPPQSYVSKLVASRHTPGVVYAAFDNHKNGDFKPYLLKTTDAGKSWASLGDTLPPRGSVYAIAEDPVTPNLLFCGTEFGVFASRDGGKTWVALKSGIPTIAVRDIKVQKHNSDLVVATFGRGFYVLDDYSALRKLDATLLAKKAAVVAPDEAPLIVGVSPLGGRDNGFLGATFGKGENTPPGYPVDVYLKDSLPKSRKEQRLEAEKAAKEKGEEPTFPTVEELRQEAEEEVPTIVLAISNTEGQVLRTLPVPGAAGLHRVYWDFREAGRSTPTDTRPGSLLPPGRYAATLLRREAGTTTKLADAVTLTVVPDPDSGLTADDYAAMGEFHQELRRLRQKFRVVSTSASQVEANLEQAKAALDAVAPPEESLALRVRELLAEVKLMRRRLDGDRFLAGRNENPPVSLAERLGTAAANSDTPARPTTTQRQAAAAVNKLLDEEVAKLKPIADEELPRIAKRLVELGAAPLPGRLPLK